jgi:uncharacterized membrane protein (GlpM family)
VRVGVDLSKLREVSQRDLWIRFGAGAGTSLAAALVGLAGSTRLAGPLLAFPAIYLAGLTLVERKEGPDEAHEVARGAVVGAVALAAFAVATALLATAVAWPVALLAATASWAVVAAAIYAVVARG